MKPHQAVVLRDLLLNQRVAALGTLHDGAPFVSMVPFALRRPAPELVIHVSRLASHTRDLLAAPVVSLLITAPLTAEVLPQALARVTIQGEARQCDTEDAGHAEARAAYLERFPDSEPMFGFADFSLFLIRPLSLRLVAGFAQARTLAPEDLALALATP